jgi:hypothetical protein
MKKRLLITGKSNETILSITLKDILKCVENPTKYYWKLLWIEGVGEIEGSMLKFEEKINSSVEGVLFNYAELLKLSDSISQLIEIVVIGDKDLNKLIRYENDVEMYNNCEYVIELVDSSFWEFTSSDSHSLDNIKQNNAGVSEIS